MRIIMAGLLALAASLLMPCPARASETDGLAALRARYHCELAARLAKLKAAKGRSNRFIIVADVLRPFHFAQCLFDADGERVLCEASSGFFTQRDGGPRRYVPSLQTVAALARLGFSTDDSQGNFQRALEARTDDQVSQIADLLLATLHHAYGVRLETLLHIEAPLAPLSRKERARCLPMS